MDENYGFRPEFRPNAPPYPYPTSTMHPPPQNLSYPPQPSIYPTIPTSDSCFAQSYTPYYQSAVSPPHPTSRQAFRWVPLSASHGAVPPGAMQGGIDIDGHAIYVGRAYFEGDWIPAKIIPGKNAAYVAYDGAEHVVDQFEILCEQRFQWVAAQGGDIPHGAIPAGRTSDGEDLFIGRVFHNGSQTVGKVHPSHGNCYIPFDGQEIAYPQYEILVLRS